MQPSRYQQVKEIAGKLLLLDPDTRNARLTELCGSDASLRREVESLLQADEEAGDFLEDSAFDQTETAVPVEEPQLAEHQRIGPYRVVRQIGSGGMGIVYEAVREDDIRKRVAVKLVKPGMDTAMILKRFRSERRISAALNHPNITMLLDGGASADQRPYFAMEFVDGVPIDVYCRKHSLSLRQQLELFRVVCGAVHYAHQNLVVHRDLKPSNILVTKEGVPKLLDFGIAKVLSPFETATVAGLTAAMPMMTPDYASPEQARGESVTTATDVYSLGVVLYELLTGKRPHRFTTNTPQEIQQVICEQEPIVPSLASGNRELRGDLDNIALKAMHKEPMRRYSSAEELSQDLERFLAGMPVRARKDTATYRASKFVRRNKTAVIAASFVALALAGGIIATAREAQIAAQERDKAERRFAGARKLANTILWDLSDNLPNLAGNRDFRREMLQTGIRYLDSLSQETGRDSSLYLDLAKGYDKSANSLRTGAAGLTPNIEGAADNYSKAVVFAERIGQSDPEWDQGQNILISASTGLGVIRKDQQRLEYALTYARKRHNQQHSNVERASVLANAERAAVKDPVEGTRRALAVAESTYKSNADDTGAQRLYFDWAARATVSFLYFVPDTAWSTFEPAEAIGRKLVAANPADHATAYQFANALSASGISRAWGDSADLAGARKRILESIAIFDKFIPNDPTDYDYRAYSALARMGLSHVEIRTGNSAAAIRAALEGIEIMKPFVGTRFESRSYRSAMGGLHLHAARAYRLGRRTPEACAQYVIADHFYGRPKSTTGLAPYWVKRLAEVADGRAVCQLP